MAFIEQEVIQAKNKADGKGEHHTAGTGVYVELHFNTSYGLRFLQTSTCLKADDPRGRINAALRRFSCKLLISDRVLPSA